MADTRRRDAGPVSVNQLGPQLHPLLVSADNLPARQKVSDAEAIRLIGLGSWRLRGHMGPLFEGLAAQIEGAWRHKVPGLGLGPLPRVRSHTATLLCSQRYCSRHCYHSTP